MNKMLSLVDGKTNWLRQEEEEEERRRREKGLAHLTKENAIIYLRVSVKVTKREF